MNILDYGFFSPLMLQILQITVVDDSEIHFAFLQALTQNILLQSLYFNIQSKTSDTYKAIS